MTIWNYLKTKFTTVEVPFRLFSVNMIQLQTIGKTILDITETHYWCFWDPAEVVCEEVVSYCNNSPFFMALGNLSAFTTKAILGILHKITEHTYGVKALNGA